MTPQELIDAYLDGELNEAGRAQLQAALQHDPQLLAELLEHLTLDQGLRVLLSDGTQDIKVRESVISALKAKSVEEFKTDVIKVLQEGPTPAAPRRFRWFAWSLAAAVLLAVGLWFWQPWMTPFEMHVVAGTVRVSDRTLATSEGQSGSVRLPDRSLVHLDQNTEMTVTSDRAARNLSVQLTRGTAAFDVAKKTETRRFQITTSLAEIEVAGTKVDVHLAPDQMTVTVYEGRVNVKNPLGSRTVAAYEKAVVKTGAAPEVKPAGRIVFASKREETHGELYTMDPDGSDIRRLTHNTSNDGAPVWSPDGQKIAFYSNRDGNWEIYTMNADGTGVRRLTNDPADDLDPSWSPDGTRIAFLSTREGNLKIFVTDTEGSSAKALSRDDGTYRQPAWSPDGTRIAFTSNRDGKTKIYIMNADGSQMWQLTTPTPANGPLWSPDGKKLVFFVPGATISHVYKMDADGSNLKKLTVGNSDNIFPAWSPDGTKIIFMSNRDGRKNNVYDLHVMESDGSNVRRVTDHPVDVLSPAWSPVKFRTFTVRSIQ